MEIVGENLCVDIGIEGLKSILKTVWILKASVSPRGVENGRCRFLDNTTSSFESLLCCLRKNMSNTMPRM